MSNIVNIAVLNSFNLNLTFSDAQNLVVKSEL